MMIASPWFLKCFMISLRFLSSWGAEVRLKRANPSSRWRPMSSDLNLSQSVLSRRRSMLYSIEHYLPSKFLLQVINYIYN